MSAVWECAGVCVCACRCVCVCVCARVRTCVVWEGGVCLLLVCGGEAGVSRCARAWGNGEMGGWDRGGHFNFLYRWGTVLCNINNTTK